MEKYVYLFSEGNASMKNLLGGKGAGLSEMTRLGLPVPQGFTITTEACTRYNSNERVLEQGIKDQIDQGVVEIEKITGKKFGDNKNPLLVSVRSGSRASMPGMMDTVLNLGLNDTTVEGLATLSDNPRFAYDSYRRFIMMFSNVVIGIPKHKFDRILDDHKENKGYKSDLDLTVEDLKSICITFKEIFKKETNTEFPESARDQLYEAITAVFRSWDNPRAFAYRRMNDIPYDWGTAVNVQSMVFGNFGENSGTGVAFTRNPATGENKIYGEYMVNAQGEDVVAGIRTPSPLEELKKDPNMSGVYNEFMSIAKKMERHYRDMQDMEFTIENGNLYLLQTRIGKRTATAALQIVADLVDDNIITEEEAVLKVNPRQLDQLLHPTFDHAAIKAAKSIGKGLPASPGAASGKVYFTAEDAEAASVRGEKVILIRLETSPEDIVGMSVSQGILTARGGMTSHAAVVARGMGTCCVSGCEEIKIKDKEFTLGGVTIKEGDFISLDGSTGNIYPEAIKTVKAEMSGNFARLMEWADKYRTLNVRTNADTPKDAAVALEFGAEGIGLARTEHMFFEEDRIIKMRKMILSDTEEERINALNDLLPFQKQDFIGIFETMAERPVTIRLLDPPLHEFLPTAHEDFVKLAKDMCKKVEDLKSKAEALHELNPMMGHRGCRLAVSYPEIAKIQARAIIEAAIAVKKSKGFDIQPEIMIPLIGEIKELRYVKDIVVQTANEIIAASGIKLEYTIGTMIEIPRACITADELAKDTEFFSFGTNDLTQLTYGLSRDDAGRILSDYIDRHIYEGDPTAKLDQTGVGALMKIAVRKGKATRPNIKLGICGEHGGDPASIEFCNKIGLSYVSCSPYRVPIARLAAAQAAITQRYLSTDIFNYE